MKSSKQNWKTKLHDIIYEADTPAGKLFDVILLIAIIASIILVMLESIKSFDENFHDFLNISEWIITILFSLEYMARVITVKKPFKYIFSFYGIIDLLSTIPKYISLLFGGIHALAALRALRLLRIFRILKLARYLGASNLLVSALKSSRAKISVFLFAVLILCIIFGTLMYLIEGEASGFSSIPISVYWCIVTLTTVGFGDIVPLSGWGKAVTVFSIISGIVLIPWQASQIVREWMNISQKKMIVCPTCGLKYHDKDASHCKSCGHIIFQEFDGY